MSSFALALVIAAAITHAVWNLAAKRWGGTTLNFAFLSSSGAALIWAPVAAGYLIIYPQTSPFGPIAWSAQAWLVLAASAVIHSVYFVVLLHGYRAAPLSVVYPIARGTGPLLSSFAALLVFDEPLTAGGAAGVLMIVAGILLLSLGSSPAGADGTAALRRGMLWGAATGGAISLYTIVDAYGVKTVGIDPLLFDYFANLLRSFVLLPFVWGNGGGLKDAWRRQAPGILAVALLSPAAYVMVLFAIQIAPVSHVAPARELSTMFGAFFGGKFLKEGHLWRRMSAAAIIACGVLLLT